MIVAVCGFMGCGKSTVGRLIGSGEVPLPTGRPAEFLDLDAYIEDKEGMTIPEIFALGGEALFRQVERLRLAEVVQARRDDTRADLVLALGGGTLTDPGSAAIVKEGTVCVYIRMGVDRLYRNLLQDRGSRPMLKGADTPRALRSRIQSLLEGRDETYIRCSRKTIQADGMDFRTIARLVGLAAVEEASKAEPGT